MQYSQVQIVKNCTTQPESGMFCPAGSDSPGRVHRWIRRHICCTRRSVWQSRGLAEPCAEVARGPRNQHDHDAEQQAAHRPHHQRHEEHRELRHRADRRREQRVSHRANHLHSRDERARVGARFFPRHARTARVHRDADRHQWRDHRRVCTEPALHVGLDDRRNARVGERLPGDFAASLVVEGDGAILDIDRRHDAAPNSQTFDGPCART